MDRPDTVVASQTAAVEAPFAGFSVVEVLDPAAPVALRLATAMAGKIAADFGAHVSMLVPDSGDPLRRLPPFLPKAPRDEASAVHLFLNGGKGVVAAGADLAAATATADVVLVEEGALAETLKRTHPAVIEVGAFPVGYSPAGTPVSEFTAAALGGLLHMVGEPERSPLKLAGHQPAYATGLTAFTALAAVLAAKQSGQAPSSARLSLVETVLWVNWKAASGADATGKAPMRDGAASEFQLVRCADGWVAVVFTVTQWAPMRALIGDARLDDPKFATRAGRRLHVRELYAILEPWFAGKSREEVQRLAQAKGVPFGPVFSPADLLEAPQYASRGFIADVEHASAGAYRMPRLPVRIAESGFGPTLHPTQAAPVFHVEHKSQPAGKKFAPLAGVRVLDFGLLTAGANTSAMLGDLGADVIKVEAASYLDPFRVVGKQDDRPGWWNRSPQFRFTNRNKRGVALDLKSAEGRRLAFELAKRSDIVVENFRRGVLDRMGLGYAALKAANPKIVVAAVSSQGDNGPERMNASFGSTLDATAGIAALTGYAGEKPAISGMDVNYPDQVVSLFATGATIAALMRARRSGEGAFVDFSQREVASFLLGEELIAASRDPLRREAVRRGNAEEGFWLQDCFRCADGRWLAVTVADRAQAGFAARAAGAETAVASDALAAALTRWCAVSPADKAMRALLAAGVAAAPSLDGAEMLADAKLSGSVFVRAPNGELVKGLPYAFDRMPFEVVRCGPDLGADTRAVLGQMLGLGEAELDRLERDGVTATEPPAGEQ